MHRLQLRSGELYSTCLGRIIYVKKFGILLYGEICLFSHIDLFIGIGITMDSLMFTSYSEF